MERPAWSGRVGIGMNVLGACRLEHFARGVAHVLDHGPFVFAVGHVNLQNGDAVDVLYLGIDFDAVVPTRQNFAKSGDIKSCAGLAERPFKGIAEAGGAPIEIQR